MVWNILKEMLFRRTCLLVVYEDASKALEKAKPNKKTTVRWNESKPFNPLTFAHFCVMTINCELLVLLLGRRT